MTANMFTHMFLCKDLLSIQFFMHCVCEHYTKYCTKINNKIATSSQWLYCMNHEPWSSEYVYIIKCYVKPFRRLFLTDIDHITEKRLLLFIRLYSPSWMYIDEHWFCTRKMVVHSVYIFFFSISYSNQEQQKTAMNHSLFGLLIIFLLQGDVGVVYTMFHGSREHKSV